jgi:hypothetical protein
MEVPMWDAMMWAWACGSFGVGWNTYPIPIEYLVESWKSKVLVAAPPPFSSSLSTSFPSYSFTSIIVSSIIIIFYRTFDFDYA